MHLSPLLALAVLTFIGSAYAAAPDPLEAVKKDVAGAAKGADDAKVKGDTAWMLASSALVMVMLPGLALFYGGMVRRKNVLSTMMHSMATLALVGLFWVAVGYGLAFGPSRLSLGGGGLIGWSGDLFFLQGIATDQLLPGTSMPVYAHVMFQGMFAIITPALISGALAERIRFGPFCLFVLLWVTFVYCPLAHMVWAYDWFTDAPVDAVKGLGGSAIGLLGKMGALDFAGGTVVHIAAGTAGLAGALVLRKRIGYPEHVAHPNSMVLTLLGAGLLWFGWFGFNGGSASGSGPLAASAFAATQAAAAAAGLSWIAVEWLVKGKPTALGLASGIVAGLVAVTPASGFVYVWGGVIIGLLAGGLCYFAVALKSKLGYDDTLDAFGVHGVGGFLGAVLTGVLCYAAVNSSGADGFFAVRGQRARTAELEQKLIPALEAKAPTDAKSGDQLAKAREELTKLQDAEAAREKDGKGVFSQVVIQLKAAVIATVFAFLASLLLVWLTQAMTLGNFTTDSRSETEGLDHTEHGEAGFDFGLPSEWVPVHEPRSAKAPPIGGRFEVVVEGAQNGDLMHVWSSLCQPGDGPADPDFRAVYPYVTTVQGNRFRFRGGDAPDLSARLQKLFEKRLSGRPIKAHVA
jgi:ammonium transporter